jgi:hypothetical protein
MTTRADAAEYHALAPVRLALHGYAFASNPQAYIARAREELANVPAPYRSAAADLIQETEDSL